MTEKFEQWCVIELFGHQQIAGKVTDAVIGGQSFVRVDVPKTSKRDPFTKFYGGGAIYAITPVEQSVAQAMAEGLNESPIQEWRLKTVEPSKQLAAGSAPPSDFDVPYDDKDWDEPLDAPFGVEVGDPGITEDGDWDDAAAKIADVIEVSGHEINKRKAAQAARDLLARGNFVIFDTETTGCDDHDEIIQFGIIDQDGNTVFESLIKPTQTIANTQYHGITDAMVADAPGFPEVYEAIEAAFGSKAVLAYNLEYDSRMYSQVCRKHELEPYDFTVMGASCVMKLFARFYGEWNDYHGNYRWKKLREALAHFGLKHEDFGTKEHDACTDARATLAVLKKMAEYQPEAAAAAK